MTGKPYKPQPGGSPLVILRQLAGGPQHFVKSGPLQRKAPLRASDGKARSSAPVPITKRCAKAKGGCGEWFLAPRGRIQAACSPRCAQDMAALKRQKAERKADAEKRERLKSRAKWLKEAEAQVNRYCRLRDAALGCVSCPRPSTWDGQWHASHFRSVGAASAVRFNTWNIHKACSICNKWKSGNLSEYEPRLRVRIGDARVNWLRTQNHLAYYPIDYLRRLKAVFSKKANRLAKRLEAETA